MRRGRSSSSRWGVHRLQRSADVPLSGQRRARVLRRVQPLERRASRVGSSPTREPTTASRSSWARWETGDTTLDLLDAEHGFARGTLDFVFLDHDKDAYLTDLQLILERGLLHRGGVVVADNVKFPGAPVYRAYMQAQEGKLWRTVEHQAPIEYQSMIQDLVLVSEYLGT